MQHPVLKVVLRSGVIALGIAGVIGGGVWYFEQAREKEEAAARAQAQAAAEAAKKNAFETFGDRGLTGAIPAGYRLPGSDWRAAEKAFYSKILAAGRFDVLVMPVMPREYAFDRATRSLLTAQLATAIERAQKAKVADPFILTRALGEGERQLDLDAAYRLADEVGAKRVVWTFIGHDRKGKMAVLIQSQDRPDGKSRSTRWASPVKKADFRNLTLAAETSPMDIFEALLPEAIKIIGGDPTALSGAMPVSRHDLAELPDSPLNMSEGEDNPARDAYTFLLLARLVPSYVEIARERFIGKAFLATTRMSKDSPEWRALRARAYLGLGYRPAALKVLDGAQTEEERTLLALLNGNLPAMSAAPRETNPLKDVLQRLEINAVAWDYGVTTQKQAIDEAKAMRLPGMVWPYLTGRALTERDGWSQYGNEQLKLLLDVEFPIQGYTLEDLVRGSLAAGDTAKVQALVDTSVFNHGRKVTEAAAAQWCCRSSLARPDQSDYMELLQSIGHDNLIRKIRFLSETQGRPDAAMSYARSIEAVYGGYPYYTLERARVEKRLSSLASGAAVEGLANAAYQDAASAMLWEQTQSRVSGRAFSLVAELRPASPSFRDNPYATDVPYHPAYPTEGGHAQVRANAQAALANSTSIIDPAWQLLSFAITPATPDQEALDGLLKLMEGRFIGSPQRSGILATIEAKRGDLKSAAAHYRDSIQAAPAYWESYHALGQILFSSGEVAEAAKVFQSYPGFKSGADANRVAIANHAQEAGSIFYWSGHFDVARPFYEIAASQNTGAAAEIASASRLKLLGGDYVAALGGALQRAQRYNDAYAYRDYLGMLHAMGHSADAWPAFMVLVPQLRTPQIWETALVGHKIAGASETEVAQWAKQGEFKDLGKLRSMAAAYLLRFATTDRVPSKELPAILDELDYPTSVGNQGFVLRKTPAFPTGLITGKPGAAAVATTTPAPPGGTRVRSDLAYFAEGYRGVKSGDFAGARAAFDEAATFYDMREVTASYMLPYRALAAAKTGDTASVEALMAQFSEADKGFDYQLARAAIAAIGGNADEALAALDLARYRRPFTEDRPLLTQYTYGDVCELLAQLTGNSRIRQLALTWARNNQAVEPWHGWSYAMEARLTKDSRGRQRAIAMLRYLDPKSERLAEFGKGEVEAAAKAWANPFRQPPKRAKEEAAT